MQEVAAFLYNDQPPPRELVLAFQIDWTKCLPNAGGLFDQPVGLVEDCMRAYTTYETLKDYEKVEEKDRQRWLAEHDKDRKMIEEVVNLRNGYNKKKYQ